MTELNEIRRELMVLRRSIATHLAALSVESVTLELELARMGAIDAAVLERGRDSDFMLEYAAHLTEALNMLFAGALTVESFEKLHEQYLQHATELFRRASLQPKGNA